MAYLFIGLKLNNKVGTVLPGHEAAFTASPVDLIDGRICPNLWPTSVAWRRQSSLDQPTRRLGALARIARIRRSAAAEVSFALWADMVLKTARMQSSASTASRGVRRSRCSRLARTPVLSGGSRFGAQTAKSSRASSVKRASPICHVPTSSL